jgi:hypothetical protein
VNQRNDQPFPSPPPIGGGLSDEAAHAIADWPLLAMLAAGRSGMTMPRTAAAVTVEEAAPIFIPPASPSPPPSAPAMAETAHSAESEPAIAPLPEYASEPEPVRALAPAAMPEADAAARPPSALEQLFNRADKAGQAHPVNRTMFKQSGPPPLKTPSQSAAASAPGQSGAVTIESRPRQWHELETVPDRLFDRVGGR